MESRLTSSNDVAGRSKLNLRPTHIRASSSWSVELATIQRSLSDSQSHNDATRLLEADAHKDQARTRWRKLRSTEGWRLGVWIGFCSSLLVLLANLILVNLGARHGGYQSGIGILAKGSSQHTSRLSTSYHVLINILSTILLSSSNYCMQVICSPTREMIDKAHFHGQRLDIGIWSTRNLRYMRWSRKVLWYALALSSLPLHLL